MGRCWALETSNAEDKRRTPPAPWDDDPDLAFTSYLREAFCLLPPSQGLASFLNQDLVRSKVALDLLEVGCGQWWELFVVIFTS